jgi:hypothetical protein
LRISECGFIADCGFRIFADRRCGNQQSIRNPHSEIRN